MYAINDKEVESWLFEHAQIQGHVCLSEKNESGENVAWIDSASGERIDLIFEERQG